MSDSNEPEMAFEVESEDDLEFVTLPEGQTEPPPAAEEEEGPKKVTLDEEAYKALLAKQDGTAALTAGLGQLAETLRTPAPSPQPVNVPQPPAMSDEELEKAIFLPGQTVPQLRKLIQEQLMPVQAGTIQQQMETNKKLLALNPETSTYFKKYQREIEEKVASLPPQYRMRPDIYELAYKEVLVAKTEEIANDKAQALVKEAVAKALAEAGIGDGHTKAKPPVALQMESGTGAVKSGVPKKKTVYFTSADVQAMKDKFMDPNDPDQRKAYYERYKKGGK